MTWARGFDFLRALEVFVAVADCGSMTAAARLLQMTQSAVSQHIRNLEELAGATLLDRALRPLQVTPAGAVLRQHAQRVLHDAEEARAAVRRTGSAMLPSLRLSVLGSLAAVLAPALAVTLAERMPVRNLAVRSGFAHDTEHALLNREVDLIISSDALYDTPGLQRHDIATESFVLVLPPGGDGQPRTLAELAGSLPLVRFGAGVPAGRVVERHLKRMRLDPPPRFEFESSEAIVAMVAAGHGWTLLTPATLLHGLRDGREVALRPLPPPVLRRQLTLVAREDELGDIPATLADITRRVLRERLLPRLAQLAPWLPAQFRIGDED